MTIKLQFLKKSLAIALATIFFSMPLANVASAAPRHEGQPPRQEQRDNRKHDSKIHHRAERHDKHHKAPKHEIKHDKHHRDKVVVHRPAPPPPRHKHKDNSGKVVGGIILGAILGAVIANNN